MNKQLQNVVNDDEQFLIQVELLKLLEQQTKKYTSGDSSSIPVELGQELLDSLLFCIGVGLQGRDYMGKIDWSLLLNGDLASVVEKGRSFIKCCMEYGEKLWEKICISLPAVENYFLTLFDRDVMIPVLNRYCPDYEGLLINLYEPIATNAIGCALLQRDFETLILTPEEQKEIGCIFENLSGKAIESKMDKAAQLTLEQIRCQSQEEKQLLRRYAKDLAVRIERMRDVDGISGIFL